MPRLFVLSGPDVGTSHAFDTDVDLGRSTDVEIQLRATSVSRRHARIVGDGGRWSLVDLGSVNGTTMDGRRIEREELRDGTLFQLGDLELRFRLDATTGAAPAREPTTVLEEDDPAGGDIELEGDWDEKAASQSRPTAERAAPQAEPSTARPGSVRSPGGAAAARAALAATQVRRGVQSTAAGGRVLQYRKVEDRRGFLSADLGQYPGWVRALAAVLAVALFVGLAYGVFRLTTTVRQGTGAEVSLEPGD